MRLNDNQTLMVIVILFEISVYFHALWRIHEISHLAVSILFGLAIFDLHWKKQQTVPIKFSQFSMILGGAIASASSVLLFHHPSFEVIRTFPLLVSIGIIILCFGAHTIKKFSKDLVILFFLGISSILLNYLPDISPLTAWLSTVMLNLVRFPSSLEGQIITLEASTIQVIQGCSGIDAMNYLLGISVICLILFPVSGKKRYLAPLVALITAFFINSMRVAILVVLYQSAEQHTFDYWHERGGALIFGGLSVLCFGYFYWLMLRQENNVRLAERPRGVS